jgi:hypothetical protein
MRKPEAEKGRRGEREKGRWLALLIAGLVLCGCGKREEKWEYDVTEVRAGASEEHLRTMMNIQGQHGWEMVSAVPGSNGAVRMIFKKRGVVKIESRFAEN